ncbi:hypothetical protein D3Z60_01865 [Lachnospiraceae bacterium]|jgi:hypothetical protein|nr:hypothetical protein [Lachnospiraceae bacterium]
MHKLQEEYLAVVKYDVKLFLDLVHLKFRLQRVDKELLEIDVGRFAEYPTDVLSGVFRFGDINYLFVKCYNLK